MTCTTRYTRGCANCGTKIRQENLIATQQESLTEMELEIAKLREGIMAVVKDWPEFEELAALIKERPDE